MSEDKRNKAVHAGLSLNGIKEDVRSHYDDWADTYDADLQDAAYDGPQETVKVLLEYLNSIDALNFEASIVDGGCGTGLVGHYLRQAGFNHVDGFDLSEAMVEKAKLNEYYKRLEGAVGFAEAPETFGSEVYDIAVTCGVFTQGHVASEAVFDFAKVLKPNGLMLVVTRPSYCEDSNFEEISQRGLLKLVMCFKNRPYTSDETAHYWIFSKL